MNRRVMTVVGILVVVLLGGASFAVWRAAGGKDEEANLQEESFQQPDNANEIEKPADLPTFAKPLLEDGEASWTSLNRELSSLPPGSRDPWVKLVKELIREGNPKTVTFENAVRISGLLRIEEAKVRDRLTDLLKNGPAEIKPVATIALGLIEPKKAKGLISPLFSASDVHTRVQACEVASLIPQDWVRNPVKNALMDEAVEVRLAALGAIEEEPRPVGEIIQRVKDLARRGLSECRVKALQVLAGWKAPSSGEIFLVGARDPSPPVRLASAHGLGECESEESREALLRLAEDMDVDVKCAALASLGKSPNNDLGDEISRHLSNPSPKVRKTVLETLIRKPPNTINENLKNAAYDGLKENRILVARVFGALESEQSIDMLIDLLNDTEEAVARTAMTELAERKGERALGKLVERLDSGSGHYSRITRLLRQISGRSIGYGPDAPPARRSATVAAWKKWWNEQRKPTGKNE